MILSVQLWSGLLWHFTFSFWTFENWWMLLGSYFSSFKKRIYKSKFVAIFVVLVYCLVTKHIKAWLIVFSYKIMYNTHSKSINIIVTVKGLPLLTNIKYLKKKKKYILGWWSWSLDVWFHFSLWVFKLTFNFWNLEKLFIYIIDPNIHLSIFF